jgi:hypothetical protein
VQTTRVTTAPKQASRVPSFESMNPIQSNPIQSNPIQSNPFNR